MENETAEGQGRFARRWPRRILVPTDFTPCSDKALAYAVGLARACDGTIHLLHISGQIEGDTSRPVRYTAEASVLQPGPDKEIHDLLKSQLEKIDVRGAHVELIRHRSANVVEHIASYASAEEIDVVVVGNRGGVGLRRWLLGNHAVGIVHASACDVLAVPEVSRIQGLADTRSVLIPLDFSNASIDALTSVRTLASILKAVVHVLHVLPSPSLLAPFSGVATINDLIPDLEKQAETWLARMAEKSLSSDVEVRIHVESGNPAHRIGRVAQNHNIDLIMLSASGVSGGQHHLLGSVAERVVRSSTCPVWVVREAATAETGNGDNDTNPAHA